MSAEDKANGVASGSATVPAMDTGQTIEVFSKIVGQAVGAAMGPVVQQISDLKTQNDSSAFKSNRNQRDFRHNGAVGRILAEPKTSVFFELMLEKV